MKLAIMQPYFLPYIGYFQLIAVADTFVVYDNIKYTKKGWINRNRMLRDGEAVTFSLQLAQGSDSLNVCERELAESFDRTKLLNQFSGVYRKAPQFEATFPLLEEIVRFDSRNLFEFVNHSIQRLCAHLDIRTQLVTSSTVPIDHMLKSQDKVLALCRALGARTYINSSGGKELYERQAFREQGVELQFIKATEVEYPQFTKKPFVPWLSIIDVLMFNSLPATRAFISNNREFV